MNHFFNKRNALAVLTLITFFMAWNRGINLLYAMFSLLTAILLLSHLLPRYALKGITARRTLPTTATEEDEIEMEITVQNEGFFSRSMIEVEDHFPAAENPHLMTFVTVLPGHSQRKYRMQAVCYKRGHYRIGPMKVRSGYPLGIAYSEREIVEEGGAVSLLVYPIFFEIAALPLMSGSSMPMSGVEAMSKGGGSEDFFGTREYRQGDSLRYVHWPSTARHATMIVKEFEIRAATEVTILLDLSKKSCLGKGKETTLEYAVKMAASIAHYTIDKGHHLQFLGYGALCHFIPVSKGPGQLAAILSALAMVEANGNIGFAEAISRSTALLKEGSTLVLLFSRIDYPLETICESVGLLRAKRIKLICIFIDHESFVGSTGVLRRNRSGHPLMDAMIAIGATTYYVAKGDCLEAMFT